MADSTVYKLNKEMEAATALRVALGAGENPESRLFDDDPIDEVLVRDTIEGETNLHELIKATMASMDQDTILIEGLVAHLDALKPRLERLKKRLLAKKAAVEQAMMIGEIKRLETPTGMLSIKATPRQLQITDEAAIPSDWWTAQDPKLDKRALLKALKGGAKIPGAQLDNGGIALQLRRN